MKRTLLLGLVLCGMSMQMYATNDHKGQQQTINLTPAPHKMTVASGNFVLPQNVVILVSGSLSDVTMRDATNMADYMNKEKLVASATVSTTAPKATIKLLPASAKANLGNEGYQMSITPKGIVIKASEPAGFYYGMQSLKKMLPVDGVAEFPCVSITDKPRFGYRGFMLDCSRHFWPMQELKKIIDLMAMYKMNVFHWHLTDDQGWRAEIKKYPKLTTIGATSHNCRITDFENGTYWINEPYGPFFYTQQQMRELVAYAAERHIDVLPEVDMPGHFCAAMASYPEFSCNPKGEHTMPTHQGGVWNDVMNVSNPKAVQFVKDIIDELCDIFPYPYFHIGGDECPTKAWEDNADCKALVEKLNLPNFRHLQSRFINEISGYLKQKGRTTVVWNESVTAKGADLNLVKEHNPLVMSWHPCQEGVRVATDLGLNAIVTEYHAKAPGESGAGGYYINRRPAKSADVPDGAGHGDDTVEGCYKYVPVPAELPANQAQLVNGVQATFWCEWVGVPEYLEYLLLPRLCAVAEAGWTPEAGKDYDDFVRRMTLDTKYFDKAGYNYHKHWMK